MARYTVHQAKSNLSKLLQRAARGEHVVIVNRNTPVARLVPIHRAARRALLGDLAGKIRIGKDFDRIPESFEDYA
jgi:prevent-host-death family protein